MRPGISPSAMRISLRPQSASLMSATLYCALGSARDRALRLVAVGLAVHELDVAEAAPRHALVGQGELGLGAIDRDDAVEHGREHLEQSPVAGAGVDGERAAGQERRERREVGRGLARGAERDGAATAREELAGGGVATSHHGLDAGERAVELAGSAPDRHRVGDHGVFLRARR
jgi:hypothetical protein